MKIQTFIDALRGGKADHALRILYGDSPTAKALQQQLELVDAYTPL